MGRFLGTLNFLAQAALNAPQGPWRPEQRLDFAPGGKAATLLTRARNAGLLSWDGDTELVFASSESGKTVVFEPGREYREIAVNVLEGFRSTPVFSGSRVYIRGLKHLWCLGTGE